MLRNLNATVFIIARQQQRSSRTAAKHVSRAKPLNKAERKPNFLQANKQIYSGINL